MKIIFGLSLLVLLTACDGTMDPKHGTWSSDGFSFSLTKVKVEGSSFREHGNGFKVSWSH